MTVFLLNFNAKTNFNIPLLVFLLTVCFSKSNKRLCLYLLENYRYCLFVGKKEKDQERYAWDKNFDVETSEGVEWGGGGKRK